MAKKAGFLIVAFLVVSTVSAQTEKQKAPPSAKVTITADLRCLHCDFGIGDGCAACLSLNKKTPVILAGKCAEKLKKYRCDKKIVVIEGILSRNKDKRLVLTSDNATFQSAKDKKAVAKGTVRIAGQPICGSCDLQLCDTCTLAIANGKNPIILDGKLATKYHAQEYKSAAAAGTLYIDKRGLVRLLATKVDVEKRK